MKRGERLAAIIKQRRKILGLTVLDVAKKIGVTRQSVSAWERAKGEETIRAPYLAALEKVLDVEPGDLLRVYYSSKEEKEEEKE